MLSLRSPLVLGAAPGGLIIGAALWVVLSHGTPIFDRLDSIGADLEALRPPARTATAIDLSAASSKPIFALTTGPGAVSDAVVALQGISRTPTRTAALISIDGKPAGWLELGATRDGVTLDQVDGEKVVVETVTGQKEVALGAASAPAPAAQNTSAPPDASAPLAGYRLPPPPANAPPSR